MTRILCLVFALGLGLLSHAQIKSPTFKYEGTDAQANQFWDGRSLHAGGLGILLIEGELIGIDDLPFLPVLPELYYEYSYLMLPYEKRYNMAFVIAPQLVLPFYGARLPAGVDLRLGSLSRKDSPSGSRGLLVGLGYEAIVGFNGFSFTMPYTRAGVAIENFFAIYQHNYDKGLYLGNVMVGVKF